MEKEESKEFRIETSFKDELARVQREYLSENITDDEIFALSSNVLCVVTNAMLAATYDNKALMRLLSFYLINSDEGVEVKKSVSDEVAHFVQLADCIANHSTEIRIINAALDGYEDGQDLTK